MKKEYHHAHPRVIEIFEELMELHNRKNHQYATGEDPLGNFNRRAEQTAGKFIKDGLNKPLCVVLGDMSKQVDAVFDMVGRQKKNTVEEVDDKLRDIAVQAVIAIVLSEEKGHPLFSLDPTTGKVEKMTEQTVNNKKLNIRGFE